MIEDAAVTLAAFLLIGALIAVGALGIWQLADAPAAVQWIVGGSAAASAAIVAVLELSRRRQ